MLLQIRWLRDRFQIPEPSAAAVQDIGVLASSFVLVQLKLIAWIENRGEKKM